MNVRELKERLQIESHSFFSDTKLQEIIEIELGISIEDRSVSKLTMQALSLSWTRDPFDRMIVAQAALDRAKLITRDRNILKHYQNAVW